MAHYLLRWQLKDTTAQALIGKPQDRTRPAKTLIEGFGGKLHSYFFALGEYDGVAICEFPDHVSWSPVRCMRRPRGVFASSRRHRC